MPITGPCRVCGRQMRAPNPAGLVCGAACAALKVRREKYADAGVPPGHPEYHPTTPEQRSLHRAGLRKRELL